MGTALDKAERWAGGQGPVLGREVQGYSAWRGGAGTVVSTAPGGAAKTQKRPNHSHKSYH